MERVTDFQHAQRRFMIKLVAALTAAVTTFEVMAFMSYKIAIQLEGGGVIYITRAAYSIGGLARCVDLEVGGGSICCR